MSGPHTGSPSVVLVVEDEDLVRVMAVDMLEDAGLTVVEAVCAEEAWTVLQSRSDIDVLFTDIEMPGAMNGFALPNRVAERRPYVRLVLTSGRCRLLPRDVPDHGKFVPKLYRVEQVLSAFKSAECVGR